MLSYFAVTIRKSDNKLKENWQLNWKKGVWDESEHNQDKGVKSVRKIGGEREDPNNAQAKAWCKM